MPFPLPFAIEFGGSECAVVTFGQSDLLAMFDRLYPRSYLDPLKSGAGPGYEVFQAYAAVGARLSEAVGRAECGLRITSARDGAKAQVQIILSRPAGRPAVAVKRGSIVTTSRGNKRFATLQDASFGTNSPGPVTVAAEAVAIGYEWNVTGQRLAADGTVLPGEIDTPVMLVEDPPFGEPDVSVSQVSDAVGGRGDLLGQHGLDRGLPRNVGESEEHYRGRIRALPDVVSPDAIRRAVASYLEPYGATFELAETWQQSYQSCWDADRGPAAPQPTAQGLFDPNLFAWDDPRPRALQDRWLSEADFRGAFVVAVSNIAAVEDVGMAYDDAAVTPADFQTANGGRAATAYDVPPTAEMPELQGAYDGFDPGKNRFYLGLDQLLRKIKAAGVMSAVVRLEQ